MTTPKVRTRRGGLHYYFARPDGGVGNRAHVAGFDIDVRGDGGYVVVPPSPGYSWLTSLDEPLTLPPAPLPSVMVKSKGMVWQDILKQGGVL